MTPEQDFVEPAYGHRSLGDVVPAVAAALGFPLAEHPAPSGLLLPDAASYVVLLVDGLGSRLLERYAYAAPYLSELQAATGVQGTAGVPSTTATSLTSLGTGLTPGTHGMVGFTSRVPETGKLLNSLFWDQDVAPEQWQPHPTAFERLQAAGLPVSVVNKAEFAGSGLTRAAHRGADYVGVESAAARLAAALAATRGPSLVYLYDGDLDKTGHRYGVASQQWLAQLSTIDEEAELLREALPASVRLVVVADHGMVDAPPEHRTDIDQHLELRDGLALLGGEARFRHLYSQRGAVEDLLATWREHLGQRAEVLLRDEAVERGWFGAVTGPVRPRLGDVVVACRGDHAVFSSVDFGYETSLVGLHGSLSADEMLIPILVD